MREMAMPNRLGENFRIRIAAADSQLRKVSESDAQQPYPGGTWRRKEVLGHLLDSAVNNHLRFTLAALNGNYTGPEYDGEAWVRLNGYAHLPFSSLLQHWRSRNELLANLVERIPESALGNECRIGDGEPVTLQFLIEDYLRHLEHHVEQIQG